MFYILSALSILCGFKLQESDCETTLNLIYNLRYLMFIAFGCAALYVIGFVLVIIAKLLIFAPELMLLKAAKSAEVFKLNEILVDEKLDEKAIEEMRQRIYNIDRKIIKIRCKIV